MFDARLSVTCAPPETTPPSTKARVYGTELQSSSRSCANYEVRPPPTPPITTNTLPGKPHPRWAETSFRDGDPNENPDASFLPELTHLEAIERGLKVMDTTALSLCMDNRLPIYVFELVRGNIRRVAAGERVGTIISTPGS